MVIVKWLYGRTIYETDIGWGISRLRKIMNRLGEI